MGRLRVASWNAAALFTATSTRRHIARSKFLKFSQIAHCTDVICIQEAHGHPGGIATLNREYPEFQHFGRFHANPAAGGVIISIRKSITDLYKYHNIDNIYNGRCMAITLSDDDGNNITVFSTCTLTR